MVDYLKRLVEVAAVAAASAFVSTLLVDGAGFTAAVTAAGAAVYGLAVKRFGDRERPTLK